MVICPVTPSPSPPTGSTRPPRPSRADPSLLWEGRCSYLDALRTLVRPGWGWWWWSRVELGVPPGRRETRGFARGGSEAPKSLHARKPHFYRRLTFTRGSQLLQRVQLLAWPPWAFRDGNWVPKCQGRWIRPSWVPRVRAVLKRTSRASWPAAPPSSPVLGPLSPTPPEQRPQQPRL